ncbi:MAG TPA: MFS transporter, partial [Fimbriimonas sp.]
MRWTRAQWTVLVIAWLGWVFDVMDAALFNFAKVPMFTEMLGPELYKQSGAAVEGRVQSVFMLGWAIGGLLFGILADRWGRARTLILTILLYSLFTGLTALCRTPDQVAFVRFLTALGIGGEWAAGAALVAETFRGGGRAPASSFLQSAAAVGPALAAFVNLGLASLPWESLLGRPTMPWQSLFLVGVVPALLCVVIRMVVREPEAVPKDAPFPLGELWR